MRLWSEMGVSSTWTKKTMIAGNFLSVINWHDISFFFRCEYIFYRGLYRTSYARLSRGVVTDTELQVAQFVLPGHGHSVVDESFSARMLRSFKEDLPEVHVRFMFLILH